MAMKISKGYVDRWFNIDWTTINGLRKAVDATHHDSILDALLSIDSATQAQSGHTGFNVCLRDDLRADEAIVSEIRAKVTEVLAGSDAPASRAG